MNTSAVSPGRAGLLLLLSGQMLPLIDTSITNVALDAITHTLAASATQLELIVALYGVAFAVCLAMGSKLGDNYGRRRPVYVGRRPLWHRFPAVRYGEQHRRPAGGPHPAGRRGGADCAADPRDPARHPQRPRPRPGHQPVWRDRRDRLYRRSDGRRLAGVGGHRRAGLAQRLFINVPICLLVLALSRRYVPETRRETPSRIDWQGTLYLALILCCLLFPMALGPELHWPLWLQLMLVAVLPLLFAMRQSALRQQQRGDHPLLPPRLLQLTSIRFGMAIALLFFSAWSGFMFCMALTMQEGLGMAPWQSGNSFIALGVAYFISALYAPRLIARYSMGRILLTGLAVQIAGLLLLCATFSRFGVATNALTLVPATALIGYGQALIVNSFYRIGMRDISASDAGAGSAILSTLQQATLGLGPAILGSLFLALARRGGGNYPQALIDFLLVEVAMMLLLGAIALWLRHHLNRQPATVAS